MHAKNRKMAKGEPDTRSPHFLPGALALPAPDRTIWPRTDLAAELARRGISDLQDLLPIGDGHLVAVEGGEGGVRL